VFVILGREKMSKRRSARGNGVRLDLGNFKERVTGSPQPD
jgi:hypothetical protein